MVEVVALLLLSAGVIAALAAGIVVQHRCILALEADRGDDLDRPGPTTEVIAIEIRNHADLAAERTGLARPIHRVAPRLIRSLVHNETLKLLRLELAEQGVDADVRLRRLPVRVAVRQTAVDADRSEEAPRC